MMLNKGKEGFIEDEVLEDDDSNGREVKAAASFVMSGIA
jgi:hypothetical protein